MKPFSGYRATSTDGVLVIHDVPIFVECSRGEHDFSRDWINAAVAKAMQAEHDGYLPPLHVRHHGKTGMDDPVKAAGFFRIKGTQEISFKGSVRMAVVADLHITDPSVKEDVLAKRLPYRSVEIFDVDKPALDSLALLDHEAPYLELPMLMVSDVSDQDSVSHMQRGVAHATFYNPWLQRHADTFNPVVACFRRGSSAIVLFEDKPIMSKNKQVQFGEKADEESMGGYGPKGRKMSDSSSKKEETKDSEQMQEGAMDCASICEAIKSGTISVADMAAIQQAIAEMTSAQAKPEEGMADEPMEDDEAKMQEDEKDKKDAPPMSTASMSGVPASAVQAMARIAGENAALKARLDARDAADRRRDDVTVAMARLEGRPLGSNLRQRLADYHKEFGPLAFAAYVNSMVDVFGQMSELADYGSATFAASPDVIPSAALKWQKNGPDAVEKAARFAREWRDLNQRGLARQSEERYIELNMSRN